MQASHAGLTTPPRTLMGGNVCDFLGGALSTASGDLFNLYTYKSQSLSAPSGLSSLQKSNQNNYGSHDNHSPLGMPPG